jgi:hypothetical protein
LTTGNGGPGTALFTVNVAVLEHVESFKFLGVHITKDLSWSKHINTVMKRAQQLLFPLRRLKRFGMGPQSLKILQLHCGEHLDWLHHHLV